MTGNGTSSTYTYDANNRLTKSITEEGSTTTTADYYYDHNGNQITKAVNVTTPQSGIAAYFMSPQTNSYLSMYEYDSYNRLKSADTDGTVTTYTYDGNNLRQSKTSNGITTQHVWDGSNMVMDGTNKFYRGATGIEFATLNGNTTFYHKDAHADVIALTDNTGAITQSYIYDAFGNQLNENENDINPFRYCGEYLDDETGLIYLRNRYYDNSIGRFITEDPIKDGLNWYVYCGNNPVMFVDSLGLWGEEVHKNDTIQWAKDFLSDEDAQKLGYYNDNTDNFLSGISPFPPSDQAHHFDRDKGERDSRIVISEQKLNDAIWQWNQAEINYKNNMKFAKENPLIIKAKWLAERQYEWEKDYALKLLGEGLHALQDVDAHGQIGVGDYIASHVGMEGIDDPNYDWADSSQTSVVKSTEQKRYNNTKNNTVNYLKRFKEGISQKGTIYVNS